MKVDELTQKIEEASGLTIDELPRMTGWSWFQGPDSKLVVVVLGQEFPLKAGAVTYAMFQDNEVVRVYTLSRDPSKASPPSRYTLTKSAPTYGAEVMSLDTFIDEIAEEWQIVAGLDELDDEDDTEVEEAVKSTAVAPDVSASSASTATILP